MFDNFIIRSNKRPEVVNDQVGEKFIPFFIFIADNFVVSG